MESAARTAEPNEGYELPPGPRRLILSVFAFSLLSAPVQGLLPAMADSVFHVGAHGYGILLSCMGAGAITGALTLAKLPRTYPRHHLIPLSMLAFSLCAMTYASARSPVVAGAALAVGGVFWVWGFASSSTAMQLLVPDRLRGRAMSVLALATTGPLPLGHLIGGSVAHGLGIRAGVVVSAAVLACFSAWSAWAREPHIDAMIGLARQRDDGARDCRGAGGKPEHFGARHRCNRRYNVKRQHRAPCARKQQVASAGSFFGCAADQRDGPAIEARLTNH